MYSDFIWRRACIHDLKVVDPGRVLGDYDYRWIDICRSVFDGRHSYMIRNQDEGVSARNNRIGVFVVDSGAALLTQNLSAPKRIPEQQTTEEMVLLNGYCVVNDMRNGIWIGDLHLIRRHDGGYHSVVELRHIQLFVSSGYLSTSDLDRWEYEPLGLHTVNTKVDGIVAAICDIRHLADSATQDVLNINAWKPLSRDLVPKHVVSPHAIGVSSNFRFLDQGVHVDFQAMRARGVDVKVVSLRLCFRGNYRE